jgi:hypothetical protein
MHMPDSWDDEQLLAALREAVRARQAVPPGFVASAKSAFAWHGIDAELAQLTYDSSRDTALAATVRSETASIRALTFTSAHLTIELEVADDCVLGQIVPPQEGSIEIQTNAGAGGVTPVDRIGCFSVEPLPSGAFRLRCRAADGTEVVTGWVTL